MIRRPPRSTPFPTRRSSDLARGPGGGPAEGARGLPPRRHSDRERPDRKSTRLNSSHTVISYAVFCLKKKNHNTAYNEHEHNRAQDEWLHGNTRNLERLRHVC